jgi:hypothetical protein
MIFLETDHHGGWKIIIERFLSENPFLTQNIKKKHLKNRYKPAHGLNKPKKLFQNPKSTRKQKSSQAQI